MKKILTLILVLALSAGLLIGCAAPVQTVTPSRLAEAEETVPVQTEQETQPLLAGGVLSLKINPEIALHYDETGKVTKLEGRNADGAQILKDFTGYEGKETAQVLEELVKVIGAAGYFVEEAEGNARRIVLELDPGSQVPHDRFLEDMAAHVKLCVENKSWIGEADYEYEEVAVPTEAAVPAAEPVQAAGKATSVTKTDSGKADSVSAAVSSSLCDVCGDDDCDDGAYCDDADEKAENLREAENRKNGVRCEICGDYDCDDGDSCDDWDDHHDEDDD